MIGVVYWYIASLKKFSVIIYIKMKFSGLLMKHFLNIVW